MAVTLRELFSDIRAERERAVAGTSAQKRCALPQLNPAQEQIPVQFFKFARHIRQTN